MAKRGSSSPDAILNRLSVLRQAPSSPEFLVELRKALAHTSPVLVTRAAELACRYNRADLTDDLTAAFDRFRRRPEDDNQCVARTAIARALIDLSAATAAAEDAFLAGARMVGGRVPPGNPDDFAADLRAVSAHGLVAARHPEALAVCTDLLADRSAVARAGAARALAAGGNPAAPLLLRLRIRVGDQSPDVLAESATGLMALDPAGGLEPVSGLFHHDEPSVRAAAALAIGASKLAAGVGLLRRAFGREPEAEVRQAMLVAAAASRTGDAVDWLVELTGTADLPTAVAAVEALGPYRLDDAVKRRVNGAVTDREDARLADAFGRTFG
jgi:HEAT repeat protein